MSDGARKKILLVEDEALIARDEADLIKNFGYDVFVCHTGEKALEFMDAHPEIDLILLDIDLGSGIDGTETARRVQEKRHVPIVFLTFHGEREMVDRVRGLPRYGYVMKNSGEFVLQSSIEMAFNLFNAYTQVRQREEQYHALVENATDGIVLLDTDGTVLDVNASACAFSGYARAEFLGRNVAGYFPADDLDREPLRFADARAGAIVNSRRRLLHKDGGLRDIMIRMRMLPNGLFLAVFHAIEERKTPEGLLPAGRLDAEAVLTPARLGHWEVDPATGKGSWSKEMFRFFDVPPEAGVPVVSEFFARLHPDDRGLLAEAQRRVMETGETRTLDYRSDPARGPVKYFQTTIAAVRDEEGRIRRLAGIVLDVTERKTAEEDARHLAEELRAVFNTLPDPAIVAGPDLVVLELNAAARTKLGLAEGAVPPMTCREAFWGKDAPESALDDFLEKVRTSGQAGSTELDIAPFGGLHRIAAYPLVDAAGRIRRITLVAVDIAETRRAETELRRLADEKALLTKEIQNRVRAALNDVTAMLAHQMQIHQDPALEEVFRDIRQRISAMITVYTKLPTRDYRTVSLREFFTPLIDEVTATGAFNQGITVEKAIGELVTETSIAFPLGLIVGELIAAALKYSFPDRRPGRLAVRMAEEKDSLNVEIAADGVPFEDKLTVRGAKSVGPAMIENLVGQIRGHMDILKENGMVIRLRVPLKRARLTPHLG